MLAHVTCHRHLLPKVIAPLIIFAHRMATSLMFRGVCLTTCNTIEHFKQCGRPALTEERLLALHCLLSSTRELGTLARFTTSTFQGACPLLCMTGQKAAKGGRLDNVILNEAEFSLLASSMWIGLNLSAVCADSSSQYSVPSSDGCSD